MAVIAEELDELGCERRAPFSTELVVGELLATVVTARKHQAAAAVGAVEHHKTASVTIQLATFEWINSGVDNRVVPHGPVGLVVVPSHFVPVTPEDDVDDGLGPGVTVLVLVIRVFDVNGQIFNPVVEDQVARPVIFSVGYRLVNEVDLVGHGGVV